MKKGNSLVISPKAKKLVLKVSERELKINLLLQSNKFAVRTSEEYLKMREKHTSKDSEISSHDIVEREKIINGHSAIKIWGVGEVHK